MNDLLLLSGSDIPFRKAQINIHQPSIKQIAYIGEQAFFTGCQYLIFSKESLNDQDKSRLKNFNDFEILMKIIKDSDSIAIKKGKACMQLVLLLLFPDYKINFLPLSIMLTKENQNHLIDKDNFQDFKNIIKEIFCLNNDTDVKDKYNPGGPQAKALVQKFRKRQKKLNELKNKKNIQQKFSVFPRYISILSVGQNKDMNILFQYTVYQLFDEFRRFNLKQQYDLNISCRLAGAKDTEEIKNWMSDIHSDIK